MLIELFILLERMELKEFYCQIQKKELLVMVMNAKMKSMSLENWKIKVNRLISGLGTMVK